MMRHDESRLLSLDSMSLERVVYGGLDELMVFRRTYKSSIY
jgi:hypothetical protein